MTRNYDKPLLSVVVVFWNGADDAGPFFRALDRAAKELPFGVEVVAVDNASSDGTADAIARRFPHARLIRNGENVGFAAACNQGLAAARGNYLLLLNPDCEATAEALKAMVGLLRRRPDAGAVGCTLLHEDGLPQHSWHREPSALTYWATHSLLSPLCLRVRKALRGDRTRRRPFAVDWLMGACLMVPRSTYERIGGLEASWFMYCEDTDWCRRMRDAGLRVVHDPRHAIVHRHGTSARRLPEFAFRRLYRSLLLYTNKHHGAAERFLLRWAVVADMAARVPAYRLTGNAGRMESVGAVMRMFARNDPRLVDDPAPR